MRRGQIMERPVYMVDAEALPVDEDSVPLHLLEPQPSEKAMMAARLVVKEPSLWKYFHLLAGSSHPSILEEILAMARTLKKRPKLDIKQYPNLAEALLQAIPQLDVKEVIHEIGVKPVLDELLSQMLASDLADLKRRLDDKTSNKK